MKRAEQQIYAVDVEDDFCYLAQADSPDEAVALVEPMVGTKVIRGKFVPGRGTSHRLEAREPTDEEREHWAKEAGRYAPTSEVFPIAIPYQKPRRSVH